MIIVHQKGVRVNLFIMEYATKIHKYLYIFTIYFFGKNCYNRHGINYFA